MILSLIFYASKAILGLAPIVMTHRERIADTVSSTEIPPIQNLATAGVAGLAILLCCGGLIVMMRLKSRSLRSMD